MSTDPAVVIDPASPPVWIRIQRGHPTADELAALVTVVTAMTANRPTEPDALPPSRWASRSRSSVRRLPSPGEGRWRSAYEP